VHHVALLCESLDRSLDFYCGVLGLEVSEHEDTSKSMSFALGPPWGAWGTVVPMVGRCAGRERARSQVSALCSCLCLEQLAA